MGLVKIKNKLKELDNHMEAPLGSIKDILGPLICQYLIGSQLIIE